MSHAIVLAPVVYAIAGVLVLSAIKRRSLRSPKSTIESLHSQGYSYCEINSLMFQDVVKRVIIWPVIAWRHLK